MKNLKKLSPALLKKIIEEEKKKLNKQIKKQRSSGSDMSNKVSIKYLTLLKKKQYKMINEIKKIHIIRKALKKRLLRRL